MVHHGKVVPAVHRLSAHGANFEMTQFVHGTTPAKLSRRALFGESGGYEIHHRQTPC
jgi:hypothetical protein